MEVTLPPMEILEIIVALSSKRGWQLFCYQVSLLNLLFSEYSWGVDVKLFGQREGTSNLRRNVSVKLLVIHKLMSNLRSLPNLFNADKG